MKVQALKEAKMWMIFKFIYSIGFHTVHKHSSMQDMCMDKQDPSPYEPHKTRLVRHKSYPRCHRRLGKDTAHIGQGM